MRLELSRVVQGVLRLVDPSRPPKLKEHYFSAGSKAAAEFLMALQRDAERYRAIRGNPSLTLEDHEAIFLSPEEIDQRADKAIKETT